MLHVGYFIVCLPDLAVSSCFCCFAFFIIMRNFLLIYKGLQISAVARIRDELAYATHTFFRKNGFRYVHTPIITTSDCEGAGEMFQVTTLFSKAEKEEKELKQNPRPSETDIEAAKLLVKEKGETVSQLKSSKASEEEISASVSELIKAKESLSRLEERFKLKAGIPQKDGKIDYAGDFFGRQAFLTVSGQLQVETYACALGNVYTFGPTFRAENSHTSRHLAEFWMVEPEIAFANLEVLHVDIVVSFVEVSSLPSTLCNNILNLAIICFIYLFIVLCSEFFDMMFLLSIS